MSLYNSLKQTGKRALATGLVALLPVFSGCGGGSEENPDNPIPDPVEERINVHITKSETNVVWQAGWHFPSVFVTPICIDTNILLSEYEANPDAYLLDGADCPYAPINHQTYQTQQGGVGAGGEL